jgi:hypothetical protein
VTALELVVVMLQEAQSVELMRHELAAALDVTTPGTPRQRTPPLSGLKASSV